MTSPTRRFVIAAMALLPAGCSGMLGGGGVNPTLYSLTALDRFPKDWPRVDLQFLVDRPSASAALDTRKIALRRNVLGFDYFADANWTDAVPSMVQALLVQSFQRSGRVTAVSRDTLAIRGDVELRLDLRHFEADYINGRNVPTVRIELGAMLVKVADRAIIATRTIRAAQRPGANDVPSIVVAFNEALHAAMRDIIGWTLTTTAAAHITAQS